MNGQFDLITLISLIVAAAAIFKLRSVLGQRTDEDEQRIERLKTREREAAAANPDGASADVITMPRRDRGDMPAPAAPEIDLEEAENRVRSYPVTDPSVTDGLLAILNKDAAFDPQGFLQGAGMAYEMIVSSFAAGNKKQLKELLTREVYDGFVAAIADRDSRGEKVDQQFVGIKRSDIVEAELRSGVAYVTVRFVSELITATMDGSGTIIAGDPQKIKDVTDIWTFSRDVSTSRALSNPNWRLMATQAPN
jgi:predicted lipid-binding transport protein (Tim44 family)